MQEIIKKAVRNLSFLKFLPASFIPLKEPLDKSRLLPYNRDYSGNSEDGNK